MNIDRYTVVESNNRQELINFKNAVSNDLRQAIIKNGDYDPYPDGKLEVGEIQKLHLQVVDGLATTNGDAGTHVVSTRQLAILLAAAVELNA